MQSLQILLQLLLAMPGFLAFALEHLAGRGEAVAQGLQLLLPLLLLPPGLLLPGLQLLPDGGQLGPGRRELTGDGVLRGKFGASRGEAVAQGLQFLLKLLLPTPGLLVLGLQFLAGGRERGLGRGEFTGRGPLGGEAVAQDLQLLLQQLLPTPGLLAFAHLFLAGGGERGPGRGQLTGGGTFGGKLGGKFGAFGGKTIPQGVQLLFQRLVPAPGLLPLGLQFLTRGGEGGKGRCELAGRGALGRKFGV